MNVAQASDLLRILALEERNHLSTEDLKAIEQTRKILDRYIKEARA